MSEKRILLISDTHGMHANLKKVAEQEKPYDCVLHMGDTEGWDPIIEEIVGAPIEYVAGNCDWASALPSEKTVSIGGVRIFMTHGHEYYVTAGLDALCDRVKACDCQVALFGHTHQPFNGWHGGILVANPGSVSRPRQDGNVPSYAIMTISEKHDVNIALKYLKK
ncbi:MAG: metallophosphoesterase [Eubacterium sp.]|nr:metallophosphoesterase [Eubacterium sp.]